MTTEEAERNNIASDNCQKLPPSNLNIYTDIATTTIYTRASADDLARMMGTSEAP